MSLPLLRRELRANYKMILLFTAVITLYSTVIIAMYDPKLGASLNMMAESMPELFAAFGMTNAGATMLEFIINYLYGFILVVIPMLCLLLIAGRLVCGSRIYGLSVGNTQYPRYNYPDADPVSGSVHALSGDLLQRIGAHRQ